MALPLPLSQPEIVPTHLLIQCAREPPLSVQIDETTTVGHVVDVLVKAMIRTARAPTPAVNRPPPRSKAPGAPVVKRNAMFPGTKIGGLHDNFLVTPDGRLLDDPTLVIHQLFRDNPHYIGRCFFRGTDVDKRLRDEELEKARKRRVAIREEFVETEREFQQGSVGFKTQWFEEITGRSDAHMLDMFTARGNGLNFDELLSEVAIASQSLYYTLQTVMAHPAARRKLALASAVVHCKASDDRQERAVGNDFIEFRNRLCNFKHTLKSMDTADKVRDVVLGRAFLDKHNPDKTIE